MICKEAYESDVAVLLMQKTAGSGWNRPGAQVMMRKYNKKKAMFLIPFRCIDMIGYNLLKMSLPGE